MKKIFKDIDFSPAAHELRSVLLAIEQAKNNENDIKRVKKKNKSKISMFNKLNDNISEVLWIFNHNYSDSAGSEDHNYYTEELYKLKKQIDDVKKFLLDEKKK